MSKLCIIAGGGSLPQRLFNHCQNIKRDFFVLAIEGNANPEFITEDVPHMWLKIGKAGTGFAKLKELEISELVMIGTIKRPTLKELVPDMKTAKFFAKIAMKSLGDDGILKALINEFKEDGIKVIAIQDVLPEILIKKGVLGKHKPSKQNEADIKRAVEVATELGRLDVGQAVIVQEGLVLGVEGIEGTGELIKRCANYKRKGEDGIVLKLRKPQQDLRVDLPTIGPKTVEDAKAYGLKGICLHAGNGLIVDEEEAIKLANKLKIFIMGVDPNEYQ
ncbi:MAG: UDP-2,3-diacylglucosamine diphosphatase LpxI [Alphaproteobacteria bacterium]